MSSHPGARSTGAGGDGLIAYGIFDTAEAKTFAPSVVFVDEHNAITRIGSDPAEVLPDSSTLRGDQLHTAR